MKSNNNERQINLPSREECIELVKKHTDTDKVFRHSLAVNKIAVFIARKLKEKGIAINIELVDRASLLHDLDKLETLSNGKHGEISAERLKKLGYPELAEVVSLHYITHYKDLETLSWEAKIVNYADKRCLVDEIVSIDKRFEYGLKRYPDYVKEDHKLWCLKLEKEILDIISIKPDEVEMMVLMAEQQFPEPTVGALIINKEGKMLLVKSNKWNNKYVIPGGHIELGETMEQALKREIKEENGLDIYNIKFLIFQEFIFDNLFWKKKHFIFFDFSCRTDSNEVKLDEEGQEYLWVEPEKALKMDVEPYTLKSIKKFLEMKKLL